MPARLKTILDANGEPTVDQCPVNGWEISYNPDDGRFYVGRPGEVDAVADYAEMRNARQYARTHDITTSTSPGKKET